MSINLSYLKIFCRNYFSDVLLIWSIFLFYNLNNYYIQFLNNTTKTIILIIAVFFSVVLLYYNLKNVQSRYYSIGFKIIHAIIKIIKQLKLFLLSTNPDLKRSLIKIPYTSKKLLAFTLVKIFFVPIMINFTVTNFFSSKNNFYVIINHNSSFDISFFNNNIYPLILSLIFFVDTFIFSFSYLFEVHFLNNKLKSVDLTFSGWLVAIICYPPFSSIVSNYTSWHSNDYAYFGNDILTFSVRIVIVSLFLIYVSATIALGTKCSNLTNRGIVKKGPYKYIRHPAYISKTLVWWLTLMPAIHANLLAILGMLFWSIIYFFRAITEEIHLLKDKNYQQYCKEVKYRFIPYIF